MPTKEINEAIAILEAQLKQYEGLLNESLNNDEILAKTKVILQELKKVAQELNELKKMKK